MLSDKNNPVSTSREYVLCARVKRFIFSRQEALKKKQQPPVSAPSPSSNVSNNAQSRNSLMETVTAQPTVPCLTSTTPATIESPSPEVCITISLFPSLLGKAFSLFL